jgi:aspartyl/asparaginyl-tRNA synthetase
MTTNNSDDILKKIEEMVLDYFRNSLSKDNHETLKYIESNPVIKNIEHLVRRNINYSNDLDQLKDIAEQYKKDQHKAYTDALAIAKKEISEQLTKEKAIDLVASMTIQEIIDAKSY